MKFEVKQRVENGFFSQKDAVNVNFKYLKSDFFLTIEQGMIRTITISSEQNVQYKELLKVYYSIETLLMILDGQFFDIFYTSDGANITKAFQEKRLDCYKSADFMIGLENVLIDLNTIINTSLIENWILLRDELDIIHNMFLYCTSSVKIPIDMKCAFLIETIGSKGLKKIVKEKRNLTFPNAKNKNGNRESQLSLDILKYINEYGKTIFEKEIENNIVDLIEKFRCTRNRIAHVKSEQGNYLVGKENLAYLMKLSLLYRLIIFDLLDIDISMCFEKLSKRVSSINEIIFKK